MMKLTQQVENREVKRSEIGFKAGTGDKTYINLPIVKANLPMLVNETKLGGNFPMRTIALRGVWLLGRTDEDNQ